VFSPYYARAQRHGTARAEDFNALNVALYGAGGRRWAMTERGAAALERTATHLAIGPSSLDWDGDGLTIDIAETTAPLPSPLRGRVRLTPPRLTGQVFALDRDGRHSWQPFAPCARVAVEMHRPHLRWQGDAYFDANWGVEPLQRRFVRWDWSRAMLDDGRCAVLYHRQLHDEPARALGLCADAAGRLTPFAPPPDAPLPHTRIWRIERAMQCEPGPGPRIHRTLEDTPFYARSLVDAQLLGQPVRALHESLSLTRFRQPWVQLLLPFRMPRLAGGHRR
jgi:carotenoid 1,2-hydratase